MIVTRELADAALSMNPAQGHTCDGCTEYDGSALVNRDGDEVTVSSLEAGDMFLEDGHYWYVNEIETVGDDVHMYIESADDV